MLLLELPNDILGLIFNRLDAPDVFSICSASKGLASSLRLQRTLRFSFRVGFVLFPTKILQQLNHLNTLVFHLSHTPLRITSKDLLLLPKSLKHIDFHFANCFDCFFTNYRPAPINTSPHASTRRVRLAKAGKISTVGLEDLIKEFDRMELEKIQNGPCTPGIADHDKIIDIRSLFPTLEKIHLLGDNIVCGHMLIRNLPDSVTDISIVSPSKNTCEASGPFPKSLRTLNLPNCSTMSPETCNMLPSSLTVLYISKTTTEYFPPIPASVTKVCLGIYSQNVERMHQSLANIPRNMIELDIELRVLGTVPPQVLPEAFVQLLPQSLEKLDIKENFCLTKEGVALLPRNITSLSFFTTETCILDCFDVLPRKLKSLSIANFSHVRVLASDSKMKLLPQTLERIWFSPRLVVTEQDMKNLPINLNDLSNLIPYLTSTGISKLPPKLHALRLNNIETPVNCDMSSFLKCLTAVSLYQQTSFTKEDLCCLPETLTQLRIPYNTTLKDEDLKYLPKFLDDLDLTANENISDQGIMALPKTLKSFSCNCSPTITAEVAKHLPRNLRRLECKNLALLDESIKYLPPFLTYAHFPYCVLLSDSSAGDWPFSIETLNLMSSKLITPKSLKYWPQNLSELRMSRNTNFYRCDPNTIRPGMVVITKYFKKERNSTNTWF